MPTKKGGKQKGGRIPPYELPAKDAAAAKAANAANAAKAAANAANAAKAANGANAAKAAANGADAKQMSLYRKLRFLRYLRYKNSIPTSLLGLDVDKDNLILTKNDTLLFSFEKAPASVASSAASAASAPAPAPEQGGAGKLYKYKNYWYKKTYKRNGKEYIFCKNDNKYINIAKLKQKGGVGETAEELKKASKGLQTLDININAVELQQLETEAKAAVDKTPVELPNDILEKIYGILKTNAGNSISQEPINAINVEHIKDFYKYYICVFNSLFSKKDISLKFLQDLIQADKDTTTTIIFDIIDIKLPVNNNIRTQYKFNIHEDGKLIEPQTIPQTLKSILNANTSTPNLINFINYIKTQRKDCQVFNVYIENAKGIQSFDFMQKFTNLKFYGLHSRKCYIKCYECINNLLKFGEEYLMSKNINPIWHPLLNDVFGNLYSRANQIEYYYSQSTNTNVARKATKSDFDKLITSKTKNRYKFIYDSLLNPNSLLTPESQSRNMLEKIELIINDISNINGIPFENTKQPQPQPPQQQQQQEQQQPPQAQLYYLYDFLNEANETINKYIYDQYSIKSYKSIQQINAKVKSYSTADYTNFINEANKKYTTEILQLELDWNNYYEFNYEELYYTYIDNISNITDDISVRRLPALCPDE
jgi:hypothetical protein